MEAAVACRHSDRGRSGRRRLCRSDAGSFIGDFTNVQTVASTVPKNGDVNPYGVAVAPVNKGRLIAGDVLVSNFNT